MLFKNAEAIELMRKVDTLVVDKTGTLTEGKPKLVVSVEPLEGFDADELLRLAATLERGSEHPLAAAIVKGAEDRGVTLGAQRKRFESLTGRGVRGRVEGATLRWEIKTSGRISKSIPGALAAKAEALRADGQTVMFVLVDDKIAGLLAVADPIKQPLPRRFANFTRTASAS